MHTILYTCIKKSSHPLGVISHRGATRPHTIIHISKSGKSIQLSVI